TVRDSGGDGHRRGCRDRRAPLPPDREGGRPRHARDAGRLVTPSKTTPAKPQPAHRSDDDRRTLRVLQASSEIYPLLKTGGLADVCGALPPALARHGCEVRVLLPAFPAIRAGVADAQPLAAAFALPEHARLLHGTLADGTRVYLIDAPIYERGANPYVDAD